MLVNRESPYFNFMDGGSLKIRQCSTLQEVMFIEINLKLREIYMKMYSEHQNIFLRFLEICLLEFKISQIFK